MLHIITITMQRGMCCHGTMKNHLVFKMCVFQMRNVGGCIPWLRPFIFQFVYQCLDNTILNIPCQHLPPWTTLITLHNLYGQIQNAILIITWSKVYYWFHIFSYKTTIHMLVTLCIYLSLICYNYIAMQHTTRNWGPIHIIR